MTPLIKKGSHTSFWDVGEERGDGRPIPSGFSRSTTFSPSSASASHDEQYESNALLSAQAAMRSSSREMRMLQIPMISQKTRPKPTQKRKITTRVLISANFFHAAEDGVSVGTLHARRWLPSEIGMKISIKPLIIKSFLIVGLTCRVSMMKGAEGEREDPRRREGGERMMNGVT
jgi:hypothetical protein